MVSLQYPVLGVDNIERATTFWCRLLGYSSDLSQESERWRTLRPTAGGAAMLALMLSDTAAPAQPRSHLDLAVNGIPEQSSVKDHVVALGGQAVVWDSYPEDPDFIVLADTEGNRFCVVDVDHDQSSQISSEDTLLSSATSFDDVVLPVSILPLDYYNADGVPSFDAVRARINRDSAQVTGAEVLDAQSERGQAEQFDTQRREQAGRDRLEQLRRSLQEPS